MFNIGQYLDKFKQFQTSNSHSKEAVCQLFKQYFDHDLIKSQILIKDGVVYLKIPAAVRSEVYIKKPLLLAELSKKLNKKVTDIK